MKMSGTKTCLNKQLRCWRELGIAKSEIGPPVKKMTNKFWKLFKNVQQSTNKFVGLIGSMSANVALPSSQGRII